MSCVYKITNKINGKIYYGKTTSFRKRWYEHKRDAKNGSLLIFHKALRKYGIENFSYEILYDNIDDIEACKKERELISAICKKDSYNIAAGGNGGLTMSQDQIESQYAVSGELLSEFLKLFFIGLSIDQIALSLNITKSAVLKTRKRLSLSFRERNKFLNFNKKSKKIPTNTKIYKSKAKFSDEERRKFRSNLMINLNKQRGISTQLKKEVIFLYFQKFMSAKDISKILNISTGSVRSTINFYYSTISCDEKQTIKKSRASIVRTGNRNSNWKGDC